MTKTQCCQCWWKTFHLLISRVKCWLMEGVTKFLLLITRVSSIHAPITLTWVTWELKVSYLRIKTWLMEGVMELMKELFCSFMRLLSQYKRKLTLNIDKCYLWEYPQICSNSSCPRSGSCAHKHWKSRPPKRRIFDDVEERERGESLRSLLRETTASWAKI